MIEGVMTLCTDRNNGKPVFECITFVVMVAICLIVTAVAHAQFGSGKLASANSIAQRCMSFSVIWGMHLSVYFVVIFSVFGFIIVTIPTTMQFFSTLSLHVYLIARCFAFFTMAIITIFRSTGSIPVQW